MKKFVYFFLMVGLAFMVLQISTVSAQVAVDHPCYDVAPADRDGHPCWNSSPAGDHSGMPPGTMPPGTMAPMGEAMNENQETNFQKCEAEKQALEAQAAATCSRSRDSLQGLLAEKDAKIKELEGRVAGSERETEERVAGSESALVELSSSMLAQRTTIARLESQIEILEQAALEAARPTEEEKEGAHEGRSRGAGVGCEEGIDQTCTILGAAMPFGSDARTSMCDDIERFRRSTRGLFWSAKLDALCD